MGWKKGKKTYDVGGCHSRNRKELTKRQKDIGCRGSSQKSGINHPNASCASLVGK